MFDCRTRGIAYAHIFVLFFDILFSVCIKQDLEKKTTQHITSFLCFCFFCFTKTSGEETMFLHNCLLKNATSAFRLIL